MPARPPTPPPPPDAADPQSIIEQASSDARAHLEAARAEADAIREEARQEGHRAGAERALAEVAGALAALDQARLALDERRALLEEEAIGQATGLAIEIAAKLVRAELSLAPERVVDVVRAAIRRASDRSELTVLVHPADLATCREAAPEILERMGGIGALQVVDEPRVERGSCIVRTPGGDVDAGFQTQLERVVEALAAPVDPALTGSGERGGP